MKVARKATPKKQGGRKKEPTKAAVTKGQQESDGHGFVSGVELLSSLFEGEFSNREKYDHEIVSIVKDYLGGSTIQSRAGIKLSEALIELAKTRAEGFSQ